MPESDRLLTKPLTDTDPGSRDARPGVAYPISLAELGVKRLRAVGAILAVAALAGWMISIIPRGVLVEEFTQPEQWVPSTLTIVVSLVMFGVTFSRMNAFRVVAVGLVYQVAMSYGLAGAQYLGIWEGVTSQQINVDLFGLSTVALWMLGFTILVPARPLYSALALVGSATAVPAIFLFSRATGEAPPISGTTFLLVLVFPYILTGVLGYIAARMLYRLRVDVERARQLGSYRLEGLLGRGGMGDVWRASHRMLARPAAVKLVRTSAFGDDPAVVSAAIARFEREAHVTAALQSPHTVELYDYGVSDDGILYYVMELLDGIDLDSLVRKFGPLAPERVTYVLQQVCASLGEAHRHQLVHRDVKPANLYLCRRAFECDVIKVLDFGLVRPRTGIESDSRLSRDSLLVGTPGYMAPEAALGEPIDGRADLYCVGCVAYWLLTGRDVFQEPTVAATLGAHIHKEPVPPSECANQTIPDALNALVLACLAKSPDDRPQTAEDLIARLIEIDLPEPWTPQRAAAWWERHNPTSNIES